MLKNFLNWTYETLADLVLTTRYCKRWFQHTLDRLINIKERVLSKYEGVQSDP